MKILLTNDDGIDALGIAALAKIVGQNHKVYVIAPDTNRSACGHALTIGKPILHKAAKLPGSYAAYSLSGTPADCVKYGVLELFLGHHNKFDLVLSGINSGPNLGSDIMYSGTVSAAFEGVYMGVKGIAVSSLKWDATASEYEEIAKFINNNLQSLMDMTPEYGIINVNYPSKPKGIKVVRMGINLYNDYYEASENGKSLMGEPKSHDLNKGDSDVEWANKGYVTVSPATMDRNDYKTLERIRGTQCLKLR